MLPRPASDTVVSFLSLSLSVNGILPCWRVGILSEAREVVGKALMSDSALLLLFRKSFPVSSAKLHCYV